jgi:hypothetical protein
VPKRKKFVHFTTFFGNREAEQPSPFDSHHCRRFAAEILISAEEKGARDDTNRSRFGTARAGDQACTSDKAFAIL